jgi:hypothetical protein
MARERYIARGWLIRTRVAEKLAELSVKKIQSLLDPCLRFELLMLRRDRLRRLVLPAGHSAA